MSAEVLRGAAALMRERAEAAATGYAWKAKPHNSRRDSVTVQDANGSFVAHYCATGFAEHAAAWHPAVALAVADWLDAMAARAEAKLARGGDTAAVWSHEIHALNVARTYLGASA